MASTITRTPFANNKLQRCDGTVCTSAIDPLSQIFLGLYPGANRDSLPGSNHNANWIGTQGSNQSLGLWTGRMDENWNSKNTTHFSYIESNSSNNQTMLIAALPYNVSTTQGETVTLEHDYTINPTTVLTLRAGIVRYVTTSGSLAGARSMTRSWAHSILCAGSPGHHQNPSPPDDSLIVITLRH